MNFNGTNWVNQKPKTTTATSWLGKPTSISTQQVTGRVGGMQTTAHQTQPLSAQLGGWFGQSKGKQNTDPFGALMSWLSPYLTPELTQRLTSMFDTIKQQKPWTQTLPQNITNDALEQNRQRNAGTTGAFGYLPSWWKQQKPPL